MNVSIYRSLTIVRGKTHSRASGTRRIKTECSGVHHHSRYQESAAARTLPLVLLGHSYVYRNTYHYPFGIWWKKSGTPVFFHRISLILVEKRRKEGTCIINTIPIITKRMTMTTIVEDSIRYGIKMSAGADGNILK